MPTRYESFLELMKLETDECVIWPFQVWKGYGVIYIAEKGTQVKVARLVYEMKVGPVPRRFIIWHSCHNRLCMNYRHISFGRRQPNY